MSTQVVRWSGSMTRKPDIIAIRVDQTLWYTGAWTLSNRFNGSGWKATEARYPCDNSD